MSKVAVLITLFLATSIAQEQQPLPTQTPAPTPPADATIHTHRAAFFSHVGGNSIFIYGTQADPCGSFPPGVGLLPRGSGFVAGVEKRGASTPELWNGWRLLVTAKHVVANQTSIIIRVNADDQSAFICKTIELREQGPGQNVIMADAGVDLAAVLLPEIKGYSSTVVPSVMFIDEKKMQDWSIGVGTEVIAFGYLYGYSGQRTNYPVVKFGHISLMSDEAWYFNPESRLMEQGYVLDLANGPGLSGSPVLTYGVEMEVNPFRYRELPPYVLGVVKGLLLAPTGNTSISEGVAVIEPASHVKELIRKFAAALKNGGADIEPIN